MQTAVIIDCIVAAVLLGFLIYGAWRGLFRAVAGLLIVILALTGAMFVARELTPIATNLLRPVIENTVTQRVDDAMNGSAPSQGGEETVVPMQPEISPPSSEASSPSGSAGSASAADSSGALGDSGAQTRLQAGELLKLMGWDDTLTKSLSDRAEEKVRDTGVSLAMAVVDSVMESFVYMVLFALSFAVLSLLLHLVARALDIAMKLPGVHLLNGLGGAVVGLIQGVLLIFLAIWLLRCLRVSFDTEIVAQTRLLSFFTSHSPLDLLFY